MLGFFINQLCYATSSSFPTCITGLVKGGSSPKLFDPSWVNFLLLWSGWVSHLWFGFGFGKFPLKTPNFQFFPLQVKKNLLRSDQKVPRSKKGKPLVYCGSKVYSGWVRLGPILRRERNYGYIYTCGQNWHPWPSDSKSKPSLFHRGPHSWYVKVFVWARKRVKGFEGNLDHFQKVTFLWYHVEKSYF